mgnify:CR=1 FL=1
MQATMEEKQMHPYPARHITLTALLCGAIAAIGLPGCEKKADPVAAAQVADKKAEIVPLSKEQKAAWRTAMKPVWKQFEGDIGKSLIDAAERSNKP